jgi:hypothetical protein
MSGDGGELNCDLCGEPIPDTGAYGTGSVADGRYCSLTCVALSTNRYTPSLDELVKREEVPGDHGTTPD